MSSYLRSRADVARDIVSPKMAWHGYRTFFAVVLVIMALVIAAHVVPSVMSKSNPPLACQLAGGHWSLWNGWRCG